MADNGNVVQSYVSRVLTYGCSAVVGSSIGSMWTWTTDDWADADPVTAGLLPAVLSVGPAILIVAVARLPRVAVAMLASSFALAMVVMWWQFASSDSSTSALVFLLGWFVGIPAAIAIVILDARCAPHRRRCDKHRSA